MAWQKRSKYKGNGREASLPQETTVGELLKLLQSLPHEATLLFGIATEGIPKIESVSLDEWETDDGERIVSIKLDAEWRTYDRFYPVFKDGLNYRSMFRRSTYVAKRFIEKAEALIAELEAEALKEENG